VTSGNPDEAMNFGLEEHVEHATRYRRAREFFDVVTGLWDSWADDAFVRDVEPGIYFDPEKLHILNHQGEFLRVRGPLNIARPIQGWPVIVQAGASEAGRQLAAETAGVIFAAGNNLTSARAFYADVKGRMEKLGRDRDHLKVLPGAFVVVGDTVAKRARSGRGSIVSCTTTVPSHRSRSRWAMMPRASIPTVLCRKFLKAMRARVDANGSSNWPGARA
jgi:alkanesulfonate monooxygenase